MQFEPYETQPGDTWESLSARYGVPVEVLQIHNNSFNSFLPDFLEIPLVPSGTEWWIDQTQPTPALIPITPENREHVIGRSGTMVTDRSQWPNYAIISRTPVAESITGYDPITDLYYLADTTTRTRISLIMDQAIAELEVRDAQVFDHEQVTRDFLHIAFMDDYSRNYTSAGAKAEELLLEQTAQLLLTSGVFAHWNYTPSYAGIAAMLRLSLGENYSSEAVAQLAFDIASEVLHRNPDQVAGINTGGIALELRNKANLYLLAAQIDDIRRILHEWDPASEQAQLDQLAAEIGRMPDAVINISVTDIKGWFQAFHSLMQQRHDWLGRVQPVIEEYENQFAEMRADIDNEFELINFFGEAVLSTLFEPLDWFFSIRDFLGGAPLALLGLIPLIPGSIGRLARLRQNTSNILSLNRFNDNLFDDVWELRPYERGRIAEQALGTNLPSNFPTIDRVVRNPEGTVSEIASIKSIDLNAQSYQSEERLRYTINQYISSLNNFTDTTWATVEVNVDNNTTRILELVIPNLNLTPDQYRLLSELTENAPVIIRIWRM